MPLNSLIFTKSICAQLSESSSSPGADSEIKPIPRVIRRSSLELVSEEFNSNNEESGPIVVQPISEYICTTNSLDVIIECISKTLLSQECSYGKKGQVMYDYSNIEFQLQNGCHWNGSIHYEILLSRKSGGKTACISSYGELNLHVECHRLVIDESVACDDEIELEEEHDWKIDVTLQSKVLLNNVNEIQQSRFCMGKIIRHVILDLSSQFHKAKISKYLEHKRDTEDEGKSFRDIYQLNSKIKAGSFATVLRGTHRRTCHPVAIKVCYRQKLEAADEVDIYSEAAILTSLRNPRICQLLDFFEEKEFFYIVLEYADGGDLFDRIGERKSYNEDDARNLFKMILEALVYLHDEGIAHCDLKPKNLLMMSKSDATAIKLADFGFATYVYAPKSLHRHCGTPYFVAPEIIKAKPYDEKSDMWSVGVILYCLLTGRLPFNAGNLPDLFKKITSCDYKFDEDSEASISVEAKGLVRQLLEVNPADRLSAREALTSSWMRQRRDSLTCHDLRRASTRMKIFNARLALKTVFLVVNAATKLTNTTKR